MKKTLPLTATLFFVATAILTAAEVAEATTLKVSVASVDYHPGERVRIEVTVQGIAHLLGMYSRDITVRPESNDGVTASLNDGVVRWDIKRPEAEMSIPLTVSLPNAPGRKLALNFKGIAPNGTVTTKSYEIYTRQFNAASPQTAALASVAAPRIAALNLDTTSEVANGGLLGKMRVQTSAAWLHEFESYKDKDGIALGYPRSFTNVDGSVMTQLADSQWDFGLAGGMYRSPSAISKNPELLASFGRNVLRGGPVLRFRSNKNGNTVLETMVGVNTGDQIQGTNYFSLSSKWEQKIGNPLFKQLGLGSSIFPKRYALQNTVRGTLNGALESWSIQEQLDIPLPIFDAKGNISPLALSLGGTWNAIWDNGQKLPEKFRSSLDIYPWVGVTYHFGPNNQSGVTIAGAKGDDYKGGGETPIGLLTTGTLVLEGGDREIKNVDMSAFDEEE